MAIATAFHGDDFNAWYFTSSAATPRHDYLAAVVVWQRAPEPPRHGLHAIGAVFKKLLNTNGSRNVLCSQSNGVVRVLDTKLPLPPDEQTLVVTIVEPDGPGSGRVSGQYVRRLSLLASSLPGPHSRRSKGTEQFAAAFQMWARWRSELLEDAELLSNHTLRELLPRIAHRDGG